jgi:hypothetical protein
MVYYTTETKGSKKKEQKQRRIKIEEKEKEIPEKKSLEKL